MNISVGLTDHPAGTFLWTQAEVDAVRDTVLRAGSSSAVADAILTALTPFERVRQELVFQAGVEHAARTYARTIVAASFPPPPEFD